MDAVYQSILQMENQQDATFSISATAILKVIKMIAKHVATGEAVKATLILSRCHISESAGLYLSGLNIGK